MAWLAASPWEIALSVATPIAVALLLFLLEARGPLAPALQRTTGLVGPYFTSVAILFGLFTSQLMTDVWQRENMARQSLRAESNAAQAIAAIARASGIDSMIVPPLKAYVTTASKEDPYAESIPGARRTADEAFQILLTSALHSGSLDGPARTALLAATTELRHARDRWLSLADDETASIKWISILVLGALTQVAIMLVHSGSRRAVWISVSLFTVAFVFCLVVVAVFDAPYEIALFNEPAATLGRLLGQL